MRLFGPGWLDAAVLLSSGGRRCASFADVDMMSVHGIHSPHMLLVFCGVLPVTKLVSLRGKSRC